MGQAGSDGGMSTKGEVLQADLIEQRFQTEVVMRELNK